MITVSTTLVNGFAYTNSWKAIGNNEYPLIIIIVIVIIIMYSYFKVSYLTNGRYLINIIVV